MRQQLPDSQSLPVPVVFGSGANAYGVVRSLALALALAGAGPVAAYPGQGPMHLSRILAGAGACGAPGKRSGPFRF